MSLSTRLYSCLNARIRTHNASITLPATRDHFLRWMYAPPSIPSTALTSVNNSMVVTDGGWMSLKNMLDGAIMFIKRTWQPSLVKRKRKHGFLERQKSVGGKKILKRRMKKNRKRLGC